jgi:hypothetical protein
MLVYLGAIFMIKDYLIFDDNSSKDEVQGVYFV